MWLYLHPMLRLVGVFVFMGMVAHLLLKANVKAAGKHSLYPVLAPVIH